MFTNRRTLVGIASIVWGASSALTSLARASIIDDRADFVGDYTVIDFETWGDGTPLILGEGEFVAIPPEEYGALGVTITSSLNVFGTDHPFIGNDRNPTINAAHQAAGSPPNMLLDVGRNGFVQFNFQVPINAIGIALANRSDGTMPRLETYDLMGQLIEGVDFDDAVVDGIVPGADVGDPYDAEYGFFGILSPRRQIAYAVLTEDLTGVDDLHFGVIPESGTFVLLGAGLTLLVTVSSRVGKRFSLICTLCVLTIVGVPPIADAGSTITGQVTGYVMRDPDPICGNAGPPACTQEDLDKVSLEGVHVFIADGPFTYTDVDGYYTLTYEGTEPVDVEADLDGQFSKAGWLDLSGLEPIIVPAEPLEAVFDPADPQEVNFVFNPNPNPGNPHPVPEEETAEATAYYHTMLVRNFLLERYPDFPGSDIQVGAAANVYPGFCIEPQYAQEGPEAPYLVFPRSLCDFGCCHVNLANRALIAHYYARFLQDQLELPIWMDDPFTYAFGNALTLLVYDYPVLVPGLEGPDTWASNFDFDGEHGPPILRLSFPCGEWNEPPCYGDPLCCSDILAGLWWDINLNLQSTYDAVPGYEEEDCPSERFPHDPDISTGKKCGLEVARQLFVDWSQMTRGEINPLVAMELLQVDDDDGDLWNGTPHYSEICEAFLLHGITCPLDCRGEGKHNLQYIAECDGSAWCRDDNENDVPDGCDHVLFVDENTPASSEYQDGLTWQTAFAELKWPLLPGFLATEVWVAAGSYTPDDCPPNCDWERSFTLLNQVRVYGGFAGNADPGGGETTLPARNPTANVTILTGDLFGNDVVECTQDSPDCDYFGEVCVAGICADPNNFENSSHVVEVEGKADFTTVLDGFTITAASSLGKGGGVHMESGAAPTIRNCRFVKNHAALGGAGMYVHNGDPTLTNCAFENNQAERGAGAAGAAVYNQGGDPSLTNCTFWANEADCSGGAFYNKNGNPILSNCVFQDNVAGTDGGGIYNYGEGLPARTADPVLTDCRFYGNEAGLDGGGLYNESGNLILTNCLVGSGWAEGDGGGVAHKSGDLTAVNTIFSGNTAVGGSGGGLYTEGAATTLNNCIFTDNWAGTGAGAILTNVGNPAEIVNSILWDDCPDEVGDVNAQSEITFSIVQGGWSGVWILDEDPLFVNALGSDGAAGTQDDEDYHVQVCSPAIDTGDFFSPPDPEATDFEGAPRFVNGRVDIGVYEYQPHGLEVVEQACRYLRVRLPYPHTPSSVALLVEGYPEDDEHVGCVSLYAQEPQEVRDCPAESSLLGDEPYFLPGYAWCGINIRDFVVIPDREYEVQLWIDDGSEESPYLFDSCSVHTCLWGDVDCNGVVNFADIEDAVAGFQGKWWMTSCEGADIYGSDCIPNGDVNIEDVARVVGAFEGQDFFDLDVLGCGSPCNRARMGGDEGESKPRVAAQLNVAALADTIAPGALVDVEVYVDSTTGLEAYQVALEATGGRAGRLDLVDMSIDTERADYVFAGKREVNAVDIIGGRLGAVVIDVAVDVEGPVYLGTFTFRASEDAEAGFEVGLRGEEHSFLLDSGGGRMPWSNAESGPATVEVRPVHRE